MRKQTKLVAVLSAAALLAVGASMTSFAGWEKDEDGIWHYYDSDDEMVEDEWRKDGSKWFYLDEDGNMATDTWVDDEYYVGSDGAMLKNAWIKTTPDDDVSDPDDDGDHWYYFDNNGRALRTTGDSVKIADIGGKKYAFDMYGRMLTGWITAAGENISDDSDWATATYYGDAEGDGSLVTNAWVYISVKDDDNEDDNEPTYHFYFASNGKKTVSTEKTIGNVKYTFDERGVAQDSWVHNSDKGTWKYYGDEEEPKLHTGWFETVPPKDLNSDDHESGTTHWYYANSKGEITMNEFKSIDGKSYAFNDKGEMVTGLRIFTFEDSSLKKIRGYSDEIDSADKLDNELGDDQRVFYLTSTGAKTGTVSVTLDGITYNFNFKSNGSPKGAGSNGSVDGYLYRNGMRLRADDDTKYQIREYGGIKYLLNENGTIQKNKKDIKDSDGYYYCTKSTGEVTYGPSETSYKDSQKNK